MAAFGLDRKIPYNDSCDEERGPVNISPEKAVESYELDAPNADWVLSLTAPTHVATSRASFITYTPWRSVVRFGKTGTHAVLGIGTVSLEVLVEPGSVETQQCAIHDVLHIPGLISNIFSVNKIATHGWSVSLNGKHAHITRGKDDPKHYAVLYEGVYRLALSGRAGQPSKLSEGENYVLAFDWPVAERRAWEIEEGEKNQDWASDTEIGLQRPPSASTDSKSSIINPVGPSRCKGCYRTFPTRVRSQTTVVKSLQKGPPEKQVA